MVILLETYCSIMKKALFISCFNWYKTRIEPIREYLIDCGYEVNVIIADYDHIKKEPIEEKYDECIYCSVPHYKKNLSIKRIHSHLYFGKIVKEYVTDLCPDFIYVQVPPNNVTRACVEYKKNNKDTCLVLDIIDLWPESMPIERFRSFPFYKKWKDWRSDCIENADLIYTECDLYQDILSKELSIKNIHTLRLFKEQSQKEREKVLETINTRKKQTVDGLIRFAYLGSMNNILDVNGIKNIIIQCLHLGFQVELHAIGDGSGRFEFEKTINEIGCKSFFYGMIFDELEKIKLLGCCDFGFNMMKETSQVGLTIKSLDYFSMGLPIINNIKGDTWKMVEEEKMGLNYSEHSLFSNALPDFNHENILSSFDKLLSKTVFINEIKNSLKTIKCNE